VLAPITQLDSRQKHRTFAGQCRISLPGENRGIERTMVRDIRDVETGVARPAAISVDVKAGPAVVRV
jgi:hypothetical protein